MGGGGSQKQRSSTSESALSKEQARILQNREQLFTKFFAPGLIELQQQVTQRPEDSAMLSKGSATLQRATEQAQSNLNKSLAQRGLAGSGLAQLGQQAVEAQKIQGLSDVLSQAEASQFNRRLQATQLALGASPTPTTAAPLMQQSSGSGWNANFL